MTSIFRLAGFSFLLMIIVSCADKDNDIEQRDIVSWIKPCLFKNDVPSVRSLSVKSDQGFLVSGFVVRDNDYHGVVISMNSSGDTVWSKQIDLEGYPECIIYYALEKSANEIVVTGLAGFYEGPRFIMWLDGNGKVTKKLILPVLSGYIVHDGKLFFNANGDICLVSFLNSPDDPTNNGSAVGIYLYDSEGQTIGCEIYSNTFSTSDRVTRNSSGDLLITGWTWPGGSLDNIQMLFMQTRLSGEIIYRKEFGSDSWDVGESVCTDFSDGYYVSGSQTYYCIPVIYPINSSGEVGAYTAVADTIHSYGTLLKKSNDGYLMFLQGYSRLYFIKLDKELKTNYISFIDYQNNPVGFPSMYFHPNLMIDGSFTFLYISEFDGISLIKTKPV